MLQLRTDFQEHGEVQIISRVRVEAMRDGVQFTLRIARQVCPRGQVLAQQPVGVYVGTTLPWGVRIASQ